MSARGSTVYHRAKVDDTWSEKTDKETDADIVTVLHVCPQANSEFRDRVTSPHLANIFPQKGTLEIWKKLVPQSNFMSISVGDLLHTIRQHAETSDEGWTNYLSTRYA